MLIYEATKSEFMDSVEKDNITDDIYNCYKKKVGNSGKSQIRSWRNSMEYMYKTLNDSKIPDNCGVAIEYTIPLTSKRIDFIISGLDENNNKNVVIIELKQWEESEKVDGLEEVMKVKTYTGNGYREVAHPSYQVWSYACLLQSFNDSIEENISLYPCAYLHNYNITSTDPIIDVMYSDIINKAPLYGNHDVLKLREFIKKYIHFGDDKEIIFEIENGNIRPSKKLQEVLASMLKGNQHFIMIDEQKVAYEKAMNFARQSRKDDKKRVLIVKGGPGTGKSVVAINLLVGLTNENFTTFYVTKNTAPREVYFNELKGHFKQKEIKNLFKTSGSFIKSDKNDFDILIVDEAHRLNEKSGPFGNWGDNQVKEIINAAKTVIFFSDDTQIVTAKDIGQSENLIKQSLNQKAELTTVKLKSQFRCNGSNGYLSWLDNLLDIEETANTTLEGINYDFKVIDNPHELRDLIYEKNKINNKSRLLAGFCWDWPKETRNNPEIMDIKIGDFEMSWNLDTTKTWAIDKNSVEQVGCIYTAQGLEFDYVGVIIGEDLRYENNQIITDMTKKSKDDRALFGLKGKLKKEPEKTQAEIDKIIKNTYKVLLTRGMKGCYVYCVDKKLREYIKERI